MASGTQLRIRHSRSISYFEFAVKIRGRAASTPISQPPSHTHPSQWVRPTRTHPAAAPPSSLAMIERVSGNDISATQMDQTSAHAPGRTTHRREMAGCTTSQPSGGTKAGSWTVWVSIWLWSLTLRLCWWDGMGSSTEPRRRSQESTFLRAVLRWRIWVTHTAGQVAQARIDMACRQLNVC